MADNLTEDQVRPWVQKSLINFDIMDYTITLTGRSDKGEGYATNVVFVTVNGIKKSTKNQTVLYLVLKVGKLLISDIENFRILYDREIFIYDHIFPEYRKFEESRQVKTVFNSNAKRIATFEADGRDIIVLENLRKDGYAPYDRLKPMDLNHMKIVLRNYAKFHAIGFAFRDQEPECFKNLTKDYFNVIKELTTLHSLFDQRTIKVRDDIAKIDEELGKKIDVFRENGVVPKILTLLDENIEESVITHGDCWNSNFLFKYDDESRDNPSEVAILDWQLSTLYSPTIDLAYFMFIVSSTEQVAEFDNLLEYYYEHLCNNIRELGSDPEKVFPHFKFREHWKRYSVIGLVFLITVLEFVLVDKEDVKEFNELDGNEKLEEVWMNVKPKDADLYLERITSVCRYYFSLVDA